MPDHHQLPVIVWGASGHAKVVSECLPSNYAIVAFFDNNPRAISLDDAIPLYIGRDGLDAWLKSNEWRHLVFVLAVGGSKGADRLALHDFLCQKKLKPLILTHRAASVSPSATIGDGCQILANSVVGPEARIGAQTIVNTNASVDHECVIGAGVHIGPGATITGCVEIGDCSMIGAGAVILPRLAVGSNSIVGAGSVVTRNVLSNTVVFGNPARVRRVGVK